MPHALSETSLTCLYINVCPMNNLLDCCSSVVGFAVTTGVSFGVNVAGVDVTVTAVLAVALINSVIDVVKILSLVWDTAVIGGTFVIDGTFDIGGNSVVGKTAFIGGTLVVRGTFVLGDTSAV